MTLDETTACPFCGKKQLVVRRHTTDLRYRVECVVCQCRGPRAGTIEHAVKRWNWREG